jgi:hypothetical protein
MENLIKSVTKIVGKTKFNDGETEALPITLRLKEIKKGGL